MPTRSLPVPVLLLLQLATAATTSSAAAGVALAGCESKCGGVDVPYPFGSSDGCHRAGFKVTCDRAHQPPRLFLGGGGPEVLEVSLRNSTVRVRGAVWSFAAGTTRTAKVDVLPASLRRQYALSAARNSLVLVGCGFQAAARRGDAALQHGPCDGVGCCEAPIPAGLAASFDVRFSWLEPNATARPAWVAPGASVLVVEQEWWRDRENVVPVKLSLLNSGNAAGFVIPAVLDWALNESSCAAAAKRSDYGCVSKNSGCLNSTSSAYGYVCRCNDGYNGNPYVPDGCQGSRMHIAAGVFLAMGIGIGMFVLLLVLAAIFATKRLKIRKAIKMREKFSKRNRRLLLRQLVDKDIAEMMIYSLEELEKATDRFDETRILGGGGHGTVYKGILSNQRVVAIKVSRLVIQKEIDEFINEVAILSQINHRNVVKLLGCCLETEVPLLVSEFIPNGTLHAHLHVDNPQKPLPWKDRLRIAIEVASSLAYLHASASTSVVHRDIKTSNILLDDRLTAKVSDFGASRGIELDQSGVTTGIQGTFGYMDPEYYYTRRLTDKSDVYSYGVMLVELLTRKMPVMYISPEGVGLVAHFVTSLNQGKLNEILDEQVIEEGEEEGKQLAEIAAMCLTMKGEDRPTMRNVEMRLQRLQASEINISVIEEDQVNELNALTLQGGNTNARDDDYCSCSRPYSIEEEILFSASLER
ncbi:putative wall-associated receptor kinase-like 16 [Panicum virgatum]|uniref:putative wall-associated receptor kinase-like 16 n=1 Tax=Panicum virgatum TaxID=38727 RepID=UPI0019D5D618|nr:putative wall-associated receptor kinase-like 16 [Panicum virgatum]